jgi:hypothetical protein
MTRHYRWDTTLDDRRLVADFGQATTTFIDYTDTLTA